MQKKLLALFLAAVLCCTLALAAPLACAADDPNPGSGTSSETGGENGGGSDNGGQGENGGGETGDGAVEPGTLDPEPNPGPGVEPCEPDPPLPDWA